MSEDENKSPRQCNLSGGFTTDENWTTITSSLQDNVGWREFMPPGSQALVTPYVWAVSVPTVV
jgi:hypothetical protein